MLIHQESIGWLSPYCVHTVFLVSALITTDKTNAVVVVKVTNTYVL